jgi:hypothetical protein
MTCEQITYYIDKGQLTQLNPREKFQVWFHSLKCKCCSNYKPDSESLNRILKTLKAEDPTHSLSIEEKKELKKKLNEF